MLRSVMLLILFSVFCGTGYAQDSDLPEELGTAQGVHKIHLSDEKIPMSFRNVDYIYFQKKPGTDSASPTTDNRGRVRIIGELKWKDGTIFVFKTAFFHRIANGNYKGINFETVKVRGYYFVFSGEFLDEKIFDEIRGGYTRIKGTLKKYKNGKMLDSSKLPFFEYAKL